MIHLGIGLMMLSEALVSWYAVETQMNIREGATTNFARDIRTQELAFIEPADTKFDDVTVIPLSNLNAAQNPRSDFTPAAARRREGREVPAKRRFAQGKAGRRQSRDGRQRTRLDRGRTSRRYGNRRRQQGRQCRPPMCS